MLDVDEETTTMTVIQRLREATRVQLIVPVALIVSSAGILGFLAVVAVQNVVAPRLPPYQALTAGTYVPGQVLFKMKAGKDARMVVQRLLGKKQTIYRSTTTKLIIPSSNLSPQALPPAVRKQTLALTQQELRQLYPNSSIKPDVRKKIMARRGAQDPNKVFRTVGLDRWYALTVAEPDADVAQMIQQLRGDSQNVEAASPNEMTTISRPAEVLPVDAAIAVPTIETTKPTPATTAATSTCSNPNDPYSCSSGVVGLGIADEWWLDKIHGREAWSVSQGDPNSVVAVIPLGVDFRHPELSASMWVNSGENINGNQCADYWLKTDLTDHVDCRGNHMTSGGDLDGADNDGNLYYDDLNGMNINGGAARTINSSNGPLDIYGSGTLGAGVIAAQTDNGQGIASICPHCSIMAGTITPPAGISGVGFDQWIESSFAELVKYSVWNGADVIDFQFNLPYGSAGSISPLSDAVEAAQRSGVVVVAQLGDSSVPYLTGTASSNPQEEAGVISVGATTPTGEIWSDNYAANTVSFVAPGVDILSTMGRDFGGTALLNPQWGGSCTTPGSTNLCGAIDDKYMYQSGTALASAMVSGTIGLMRSVDPTISVADVHSVLETTSALLTSDREQGNGLINTAAAVTETRNRKAIDLKVNSASSASLGAGDTISVTLKVDNIGHAPAGPSSYKVYNPAAVLVTSGTVPSIPGQSTATLTFSFASTSRTFHIDINKEHAVLETNYANNGWDFSILPDYAVWSNYATTGSFSASWDNGTKTVSFTQKIGNNGQVSSPPASIKVYKTVYGSDSGANFGDILFSGTVPSIAANTTLTYGASFQVAAYPGGHLYLTVNDDHVVQEVTESNNVNPNLFIKLPFPKLNPIAEQSVNAGSAVTFTVTGSVPGTNDPFYIYPSAGLSPGMYFSSGWQNTPDSTPAAFTWTPTCSQVGKIYIYFAAQNLNGMKGDASSTTAIIDVLPTNTCGSPDVSVTGGFGFSEPINPLLQHYFAVVLNHGTATATHVALTLTIACNATGTAVYTEVFNIPNLAPQQSYTVDHVSNAVPASCLQPYYNAGAKITLAETELYYPAGGFQGTADNQQGFRIYTHQAPIFSQVVTQTTAEKQTLSFRVTAQPGYTLSPQIVYHSPLPRGAGYTVATQTSAWTPDYDQEGSYHMYFGTIVGSGADQRADYIDIPVTVSHTPAPPHFTPVSSKVVRQGVQLTLQFHADDPDVANAGDVLTYSSDALPSGAAMSRAGLLFWTPSMPSGLFSFPVMVTDSTGRTDQTDVVFTVTKNNPPVLSTPSASLTVTQGVTAYARFYAFDPDYDRVRFRIDRLPPGVTFDENTGLLTMSFPVSRMLESGYALTISADDGAGGVTSRSIYVGVQPGKGGGSGGTGCVGNKCPSRTPVE